MLFQFHSNSGSILRDPPSDFSGPMCPSNKQSPERRLQWEPPRPLAPLQRLEADRAARRQAPIELLIYAAEGLQAFPRSRKRTTLSGVDAALLRHEVEVAVVVGLEGGGTGGGSSGRSLQDGRPLGSDVGRVPRCGIPRKHNTRATLALPWYTARGTLGCSTSVPR